MVAYNIEYTIRGKEGIKQMGVDARNLKSAKRKIGKKHGYKDGRMINIYRVFVIGYY